MIFFVDVLRRGSYTEMEVIEMQIGVVGLGLMGGSFCRALKAYTDHTVLGKTRNPATVAFAESVNAIDGPVDRLDALDLCLTALPPEETVRFLTENVNRFRKKTVVIDICGVKQMITDRVDRLYYDAGVHFLGCHPMAGRENAGFANSDANLYRGASFIMTPTELTHPSAPPLVAELMREIGFARIVEAAPAEHDRIIAYTSQLAHVVSSAYMKSPTGSEVSGFSAGSFQDMTRVAKLDPELWTTLFLYNRQPLLREIDTLIDNLTRFRELLTNSDKKGMIDSLDEGRRLREEVLRRQLGDRT